MQGSPPHTCTASPYQYSCRMGQFLAADSPTWMCHHPKALMYIRVHSWWWTFCGFAQCIRTWIHHYSAAWSVFMALKTLCALPVCPSPPSPSPTDLFIFSTVLPFPECHIVGIIQCVAFSNLLPALPLPRKVIIILISNVLFLVVSYF